MTARRAQQGDLAAGVALLVLGACVVYASYDFREDGWLLPTVLSCLIGVGALVLVVRSVSGLHEEGPGDGGQATPQVSALSLDRLRLPAILLLLTIAYAFAIPRVGFYVSSAVYMPVVLGLLGLRRWWIYLVTIVGFLAFIHLVFERTFFIPLPHATWL
jgi:Tripartite tricarboxylate transporter TctB family